MRPDILVVDDDPCMRELLRMHLSEAGYEVRVVFADATMPMVPTLFITSNADFAAHAEGLGCDFLAEPVLKDRLLAAVARNLHCATAVA